MDWNIFDEIVDCKYSEGSICRSDVYEACEQAYLAGQLSVIGHDSDCSLHNEPAMKNEPCDCTVRSLSAEEE